MAYRVDVPIPPSGCALVHKVDVGFTDHGDGVQGIIRPLVATPLVGGGPGTIVDEWSQLIEPAPLSGSSTFAAGE